MAWQGGPKQGCRETTGAKPCLDVEVHGRASPPPLAVPLAVPLAMPLAMPLALGAVGPRAVMQDEGPETGHLCVSPKLGGNLERVRHLQLKKANKEEGGGIGQAHPVPRVARGLTVMVLGAFPSA